MSILISLVELCLQIDRPRHEKQKRASSKGPCNLSSTTTFAEAEEIEPSTAEDKDDGKLVLLLLLLLVPMFSVSKMTPSTEQVS